ncbi:hypothetical protein [Brachybacterium tyrofermentans]|uniref:hypothetical protein n=1 Tax=Brachybacterium tyrofermentans TaxID=47848 RepID=UPI003FD4F4A2
MIEHIELWVQDEDPEEPCPNCDMVDRYFANADIPVTKRGLSEASEEQRSYFRTLGLSAPAVLTEHHGDWAGLRPDKMRQVKKDHLSSRATASSTSPPSAQQMPLVAGSPSSVSM